MKSLFYDSDITYDEDGTPIYDRPNGAEELRILFSSLFSNGVFSTNNDRGTAGEIGLKVTSGEGMTVEINSGMCHIEGSFGWETETREMEIEPSGEQDRIDSVVARSDLRSDVRSTDLYIKKGTVLGDPTPPPLQRDMTIYEIRLADILIPAHSTAVNNTRITDTRLKTEECGLVVGLIKEFDTTDLYNQIQADLDNFQSTEEADFKVWLDSIKDLLDDSTAGNLLNLINTKVDKTSVGQPNGVASLDGSGVLVQKQNVNTTFLDAHPIGDIYITTVATNPGTRFGGTWVAWGSGQVPVGVNTSDAGFATVEKTGGAKTHTLTVKELPNHGHYVNTFWNAGSTGGDKAYNVGSDMRDPKQYAGENNKTYTSNTGGNQAHNNLQPYITCYMWKRTT